MKLKKMMALVLCAATVAGFGLTGCGNSDNGAADNAGSAATESGSTDSADESSDFPETSAYYPVKMDPVQEALSSSCSALK